MRSKSNKGAPSPINHIEDFAISIAVIGAIVTGIERLFPSEDPNQSPARLLWLVGPFLVAAYMTTRDKSWAKLGLSLGTAKAWPWYLCALLVTPVLSGILYALAISTGMMQAGRLAPVAVVSIISPLVLTLLLKNLFEEFYWRGFFTSHFEDTRLAGLSGHILTGIIWAVWHLPLLLLFTPARQVVYAGGVPVGVFVGLSFVALPLQAIFYGELRLLSRSVWPPFLMHSISNLGTLYLLKGGFRMEPGFLGLFLAPGTQGLLYSILLAALGLVMLQHRKGSLYWIGSEPSSRAKKTSKKPAASD